MILFLPTNTSKDANYSWMVCPSNDKIGLYSCGLRSRNMPQLARAAAILSRSNVCVSTTSSLSSASHSHPAVLPASSTISPVGPVMKDVP